MQDERLTMVFNAAAQGREQARLTPDEASRAGTDYTAANIGVFCAINGILLSSPVMLGFAAVCFYKALHRLPDDGLPAISPNPAEGEEPSIRVMPGLNGSRRFLLSDQVALDIAGGKPEAIRDLVDAATQQLPSPPPVDTSPEAREKLADVFAKAIRKHYDFKRESVRKELLEQSGHSMIRKYMAVAAAIGAVISSPTLLAVGIAGIVSSFLPILNPHNTVERMIAPFRHDLLDLSGRLQRPDIAFIDTASRDENGPLQFQNELRLPTESMNRLSALDPVFMEDLMGQCRKEKIRRLPRRTRLLVEDLQNNGPDFE